MFAIIKMKKKLYKMMKECIFNTNLDAFISKIVLLRVFFFENFDMKGISELDSLDWKVEMGKY